METLCSQTIKIKINNLQLKQQETIYSVTIITQLIQQIINLLFSEHKELAIPQEVYSIIKTVRQHKEAISLVIIHKKQIINNKVHQLTLQQEVCLISEGINKMQLELELLGAYLEITQLKKLISNQQLLQTIYSEIIMQTKLQINQHKLNPLIIFSKTILPNNKLPLLLTIPLIILQIATKIIHQPQVICLQEETSLRPKINLVRAVAYLQIIKTLNNLRVIQHKKKIIHLLIQQIMQAEVLCLVNKMQVIQQVKQLQINLVELVECLTIIQLRLQISQTQTQQLKILRPEETYLLIKTSLPKTNLLLLPQIIIHHWEETYLLITRISKQHRLINNRQRVVAILQVREEVTQLMLNNKHQHLLTSNNRNRISNHNNQAQIAFKVNIAIIIDLFNKHSSKTVK